MKTTLRFLFVFLCLFRGGLAGGQTNPVENLRFTPLSAFEDLPSEEVTQILQDSNGYLWIATNSGFCRYDGYRIRTYKDNLLTPGLLPSNGIKCLTEDKEHRLWIGTDNGLCRFDLVTGRIEKIADPRLADQVVSTLYATSDGSVWIGMDEGLFRAVPGRDTLQMYQRPMEGAWLGGVKTILEDSRGRIWFGTWANGYYRYDPGKDRFTAYPSLNPKNSVHVLFEDSRHTLWIGTWDYGLYRLETPDSPETVRWKAYRHDPQQPASLADDIVYCLQEDVSTHTLWVGTRSGLSLLDTDRPEKNTFINYLPGDPRHPLPYNELNALIRDRSGMFWLGMMGGGVYAVNRSSTAFPAYRLESVRQRLFSSSVRSLFVDSDETLWLGIGSYGLMLQPKGEKEPFFYKDPQGLGPTAPYLHTINCIIERRNRRSIWMGTWGNGIYTYDKATRQTGSIRPDTHPWLADTYIFSLLEDRRHNVWMGGRNGLSVYKADGTGVNLTRLPTLPDSSSLAYTYYALLETRDGAIWLGTNHGIVKATGDLSRPEQMCFASYCLHTGRLSFEQVQCLHEDAFGRLWVGSEGGGLNLYDPEKDEFISVNERYGLLADAVFSIQEDKNGNLWLGTNSGLVRLAPSRDASSAVSRIYTTTDGLCNTLFIRNAACAAPDGRLYFGGHNGYNCFDPAKVKETEIPPAVTITDIAVFNTSLNAMPPTKRNRISSVAPDFAETIRLCYDQNNFSIEFSSLSFINPSKNKYAYRLDGYDTRWQYTGASNRVANYTRLPAGTYTFRLKGSNENGLWSDTERTLAIEILPPPWQTPWAYACYALAGLFLIAALFRSVRNRIREKQRRQLEALEKAKAEEINHAKLQFFTNITHEFMTPLTILSASLDELKLQAPENTRYYTVMYGHINRLIRLIQQILEFRKAETGNLKLKVSSGDLLAFIRKEVEAFRPWMKKKRMHFTLHADRESIPGYFDSDKLDKILYNLLSNASKYNKEGGTVEVAVRLDPAGDRLVFSVSDNGPGISREAMKSLFKRFYEGDYRRFNTIGTGIGLSLTKDLVDLYGGTIRVESEEGQGATFIVTLPIAREAFSADQIDERPSWNDLPATPDVPLPETEETRDEETIEETTGAHRSAPQAEEPKPVLLLVEDNEDLLALMVRLLRREYGVYTAGNGREALSIIENQEIHLIVSDVMMPVMDGIELCRQVKANADICHIPILLLTAKNKEEDRIEAYQSGADSFLSKPFNLSLLHARIRNLLRSRERTARDFKKQLVFEARELDYTSLDEDFLQRAIACVQQHLDDGNFDQQQFIEEMATSKSTLYKKLKSLTGLNTSAFIRNIRLKAACQLMEQKKRVRISEIAYAVGFNDPKYFSACFKKEFGLLPTEYLEKYFPEHATEEERANEKKPPVGEEPPAGKKRRAEEKPRAGEEN